MTNTSSEGEIPAPDGFSIKFSGWLAYLGAMDIYHSVEKTGDAEGAVRKIAATVDELRLTDQMRIMPGIEEITQIYESLFSPSALENDAWHDLNHQFIQDFWAFDSACARVVGGRNVVKTRRSILALGPANTRQGDQVWLIRDAHTSFLLRPVPCDTTYMLVSDCYVHGFMHGEMLDHP